MDKNCLVFIFLQHNLISSEIGEAWNENAKFACLLLKAAKCDVFVFDVYGSSKQQKMEQNVGTTSSINFEIHAMPTTIVQPTCLHTKHLKNDLVL